MEQREQNDACISSAEIPEQSSPTHSLSRQRKTEGQYLVARSALWGLTKARKKNCLSYTKGYVYRLVKDGVIPCMNGKSGKQVRWIDFIHWYSHLPETPASPIGEASFSIAGLIKLTGMGRCWRLKFVTRYGVRSYSVGWLKRYYKEDVMAAWAKASCYVKPWLSIDEAMTII